MINIKNAAQKLQKKFDKGFHGIDIHMRFESVEEWNKNYAIFILECSTESFLEEENEYVTFDHDKFMADLKNYLRESFGDDVEIKHYPMCDEWEIIRKE